MAVVDREERCVLVVVQDGVVGILRKQRDSAHQQTHRDAATSSLFTSMWAESLNKDMLRYTTDLAWKTSYKIAVSFDSAVS